ncbi:MAG: four helix bundle protein [Terracidiphilus sp.]|nr:four helix bundle protein [Terracidiphilus sp.]
MARPKNFHELIVWQKAMGLVKAIYRACQQMPKTESYALRSQLYRCAISIPSNIAEGHGRLTDAQFKHFLGNARGSLCEAQTQIELARDFGWLNTEQVQGLIEMSEEVARLLNGLIAVMSAPDAKSANSANAANHANSAMKDFK